MKSSDRSLALRIALLIEEHSAQEIRGAVKLLESHGIESDLLVYLAARQGKSQVRSKATPSESATRPLAENALSRSVVQLRDIDPEKFKLLSEFDQMLRRGQVLATHESMKRFGERMSKDFQHRKSRKETISPLLAILSERSLSEIEALVEYAASFGVAGDTDEYQRLAQFLIKGKSDDSINRKSDLPIG